MSGAPVSLEPSPFARAAGEMIALGYHPLPIEPATKRPGKFERGSWWAMSEWQRFRDRAPTEFERGLWSRNYPSANIGIVLGTSAGCEASGSPALFVIGVDIDIDDPDDFDTIVRQLPPSPMRKAGRKGMTLFYRAPREIRSKPYNRAGDKKRLVDVLTGFDTRQTVTPPSIHPETGRPYAWLSGPVAAIDLPIFDGDHLAKLEEALAACGWDPEAERTRPVRPASSQRVQDDLDDIWSEVKAAALANLDAWVPDLELYDCRRARGGYEAVATWRGSSSGRPTTDRKRNLSIQPSGIRDFGTSQGYSAIDLVMAAQDCDQPAATAWLRERLGIASAEMVYLPATSAPVAVSPAATPVSALQTSRAGDDELPDRLTKCPGLLGEVTEWIVSTARWPQRGLSLAAALTIVGTAAGRKYAGPTRSATHLYVLGIARSSAGKNHPLKQIARVLKSVGMQQHLGPSNFMSLSSLVNRIISQPLTVCAMDEFGAFLTRINDRRARGDERQMSGVFREAWGNSFDVMSMPAWAQREPDPVDSPALSIFGVSTHQEFYNSLSGSDVANGFLNRFLLISTRKKPSEREPKLDPFVVPEPIRLGLHRLYGSGSGGLSNPLVSATAGQADVSGTGPLYTATWADDDAEWVYRAMMDGIEKREAEMDFLGRTGEIALRLATIRAVGVNHLTPVITAEDMAWARDLALWSAERMIAETSDYMADTQNQADAQRVLRILRERGGEMQHGELVHAMRHRVKARDLKDLIAGLIEAGQVLFRDDDSSGPGRKARLYRLA